MRIVEIYFKRDFFFGGGEYFFTGNILFLMLEAEKFVEMQGRLHPL